MNAPALATWRGAAVPDADDFVVFDPRAGVYILPGEACFTPPPVQVLPKGPWRVRLRRAAWRARRDLSWIVQVVFRGRP